MKKSEKDLIRMYAFYREFNELVDSSLNICLNLNSMLGGAGDALVDAFLDGLTKQLPRDIKLLRKYRKNYAVKEAEDGEPEEQKPDAKPPTSLPAVAEETRVVVCEVKDGAPPDATASE